MLSICTIGVNNIVTYTSTNFNNTNQIVLHNYKKISHKLFFINFNINNCLL